MSLRLLCRPPWSQRYSPPSGAACLASRVFLEVVGNYLGFFFPNCFSDLRSMCSRSSFSFSPVLVFSHRHPFQRSFMTSFVGHKKFKIVLAPPFFLTFQEVELAQPCKCDGLKGTRVVNFPPSGVPAFPLMLELSALLGWLESKPMPVPSRRLIGAF